MCCDYIGTKTSRMFQQSIVAAQQKSSVADDSSCDKGLHLLAYSTSHKETSLLLLDVTLRSVTITCSVLSLVPRTESVPLPDRGEEQRGGEDPAGERGRGVEGLL